MKATGVKRMNQRMDRPKLTPLDGFAQKRARQANTLRNRVALWTEGDNTVVKHRGLTGHSVTVEVKQCIPLKNCLCARSESHTENQQNTFPWINTNSNASQSALHKKKTPTDPTNAAGSYGGRGKNSTGGRNLKQTPTQTLTLLGWLVWNANTKTKRTQLKVQCKSPVVDTFPTNTDRCFHLFYPLHSSSETARPALISCERCWEWKCATT